MVEWERAGSQRDSFLLALLYKRVLAQKCKRPNPGYKRIETPFSERMVAHTGCETGCFLLFAGVHSVLKLPHFVRR